MQTSIGDALKKGPGSPRCASCQIQATDFWWRNPSSLAHCGCSVPNLTPKPSVPVPPASSPVTMTGRMLAFLRRRITGLDSGLRTFFMTRSPRKVRLLSAESLWGYSELFGFTNRSGSTRVNRPIHPGGSQQLLQHGVGFNCLQAARMGQLAGQQSTKHPLKYSRRAGDPTTAICRSCCRKAPAHHHVTGAYGYFASTRAACSRKEGLGLTLPLGLSRPGPFPCSLAACYSQSWKRQPALMETAHKPVP